MRKSWMLGAMLAFAPTMAVAAPATWDCDTAAGSFSQLLQVQPGPAYRVRGTIRWLQARTDRAYLPFAQVGIGDVDHGPWVAVAMSAPPRGSRVLLKVRSGSGAHPQEEALGDAGLNEGVPFELSVSESGEVTASIGTQRRTLHIAIGANAPVAAVCSTGEFEFSDLELVR